MTLPCSVLLGALLAVVASAQFPRLPKIDPGHLAGVVKSAEKAVKQQVSQNKPEDLVSKVAKNAKDLQSQAPSVADSVAKNAAQAAEAAAQTAEAAKSMAANAALAQQQVAAAPTPLATAAPTVVSEDPPDEDHHEIVHTDKLLEAVQGHINKSGVSQVLGGAPKNLPEAANMALDPTNIKKAKEGLQNAKSVVQANSPKVQDLASKLIPGLNPSKVMNGVNKVVGGASQHVEKVQPIVDEVLKSDPTNVVHAGKKAWKHGVKHVGDISKKDVRHFINGKHHKEEEVEEVTTVEAAAEYAGSHWQWSLVLIVGAVAAASLGWYVMKRRDSRTPTLLADNDMAGWMGGGPSRSSNRAMHSEEPLFRQF